MWSPCGCVLRVACCALSICGASFFLFRSRCPMSFFVVFFVTLVAVRLYVLVASPTPPHGRNNEILITKNEKHEIKNRRGWAGWSVRPQTAVTLAHVHSKNSTTI